LGKKPKIKSEERREGEKRAIFGRAEKHNKGITGGITRKKTRLWAAKVGKKRQPEGWVNRFSSGVDPGKHKKQAAK